MTGFITLHKLRIVSFVLKGGEETEVQYLGVINPQYMLVELSLVIECTLSFV